MSDEVRAIEKLLYAYAERIDAGDFAGVGALFRNGRIKAAPGVVHEGVEAVRRMYETTVRIHDDGTPRTHHVTTNVAVDIAAAEKRATARSCYTVFQQTDELALQAIIAGRYHDTFQCIDGRWFFDTREMFVDLTGDLGHHLRIEL